MTRHRKRSNPVTVVQTFRKKQKTTQLIAEYHTLNKQLDAAIQKKDQEEIKRIRDEMSKIGGLERYQQASIKGGNSTKGLGGCGKWVLPHLMTEMQRLNSDKLRILDVGAIDGAMLRKHTSKFAITMIDLNPMGVGVEQQDFFERPLPQNDTERFHVICLSLVVNFVGEPSRRGEMLQRVSRFLLPNGCLYLVLPKQCIENSRYMNEEHLIQLMASLNYGLLDKHLSPKLAFYFMRHKPSDSKLLECDLNVFTKKRLVNDGKKRNNFCILLKEIDS